MREVKLIFRSSFFRGFTGPPWPCRLLRVAMLAKGAEETKKAG